MSIKHGQRLMLPYWVDKVHYLNTKEVSSTSLDDCQYKWCEYNFYSSTCILYLKKEWRPSPPCERPPSSTCSFVKYVASMSKRQINVPWQLVPSWKAVETTSLCCSESSNSKIFFIKELYLWMCGFGLLILIVLESRWLT